MNKKYAPVVVFVYNRPEHAEKTLNALGKAIGAVNTDVYVFSDGAKGEKDKEAVMSTRNILYKIKQKHCFQSFHIIKQTQNMGLAASIIDGVSEIINRYGRIIVLEDDLIVQDGILNFLNGALEYYKQDRKIWSVSGFTIEMDALKKYPKDVYFGYRGSSYAWATWKNRWQMCDWDVRSYRWFRFNPFQRALFNRGGADMSGMLDAQMMGLLDSWAIRWNYSQFKKNMYTVFASKSLAACIGYDGSGTHCGKLDFEVEQTLWNKKDGFKFEPFAFNLRILKEFYRHFSGESFLAVNCKIRATMLLLFHIVMYSDNRSLTITTVRNAKRK